MTLPITGFAHIGIRVHDLDRSRAFYESLGWDFVAGPIGPEPVALLHHTAGLEINLILNSDSADATNILMDVPQKHPGLTHIAIFVASIDDTKARLAELGIPLSGEATFPGGVRAVFVRDPDRNVLEFDERPA